MNRKTRLSKSERGMAMIVALLAVFVLMILGTSVLFTTTTDEVISRNYAAEVDALFAANTGLQLGIRNAMVDAMCNTSSQWQNSIISVGCDTIVPNPIPPGTQLDSTGTITGVQGSYYYDAADFLQTVPACAVSQGGTGCDGIEWSTATLGLPFDVDGDDASPSPISPLSSDLLWSRNGPGTANSANQWLPNGASYRLQFQGVPETTLSGGETVACSADSNTPRCNAYQPDHIRILSTGMSGTAMQGGNVDFDGSSGDSLRRAVRQVIATFKVKDIGIWTNAFFSGGSETFGLRGNATIRGSVHIRNGSDGQAQGTNDPALELKGNASILNHWVDIGTLDDSFVIRHFPAPPEAGPPHSLEGEFRIRCGNMNLNGNPIGEAATTTNNAAAPLSTQGKGPMDGAYLFEPACTDITIDTPSTIVADTTEEYDATGFDLPFPDYWAAYTDSCDDPFAGGYDDYIKGAYNGFNGVQALNITAAAASSSYTVAFAEFADDCTNNNCPLAFPIADATVRFNLAAERASASDHGNGVPGNDRGGPNPGTDRNMDFLSDPGTNIVGVFKHLPGLTEANVSCKYGDVGGGHGFIYIPPGVGMTSIGAPTGSGTTISTPVSYVSGGFTNPAAPKVSPRDVTRWIKRTIQRYNPTITDAHINAFLGRAPTASEDAAIGAFVDLPDVNGTFDGINNGGHETEMGRLMMNGAFYVFNQDVFLGINKNSALTDIAYMGRGTFAIGVDNTNGALPDVTVKTDNFLTAMRTFPCEDALGMMSPDKTQIGNTGRSNKLAVMGAFYGRNEVELSHLTSAVGSAVGTDVVGGTNGASIEIIQVPGIEGCLPPEMIGDWTYYATRTISWAEH